jgi:hypothetical protein
MFTLPHTLVTIQLSLLFEYLLSNMQHLSILLGLAAAAAAADIRFFYGDKCTGNYIACTNVNPNVSGISNST